MAKVLVVDDEPLIVEGIRMLLELNGIEAAGASDAASAEMAIANEFFPVILADLRMQQDDDGFRLLQAARRISPRSRVGMLTAWADEATERRLREAGARLVLRKPMLEQELMSAVAEMLQAVADAEAQHADLGELYLATRKRLTGISRGVYGLDADDADEVIQETWLVFLEKRAAVQTPSSWLTGAAANLCKQRVDRHVRARARAGELVESAERPRHDEHFAVRRALARLDERSRKLCELIAIEGHSYDEVASMLSMPKGSVGPMYLRAKAKLRRLLTN